jgi:transcription elongation factor GreA
MTDEVNLTQNSDYQTAAADQAANDSRIVELEDKLTRAEVIDLSKQSGDVVRFGATVTVVDEDSHDRKTWQIVGEPEADARCGRISVFSPAARAFMGKSRGDTVEVHAPAGVRSYIIKDVEWSDALSSA